MLTAREVKKLFKEHGLSPKKWMGQNLLVDSFRLERIVDAAGIAPGEPIVEIGAGLGVLTEAMVRQGARVVAIELDSGFFRVLKDKFEACAAVELVHADAVTYDFRGLAARLGRIRVVANLPYNVSSRLVFRFCEHPELFGSLHILLQKEVAERFTAPPGTRDYGILTVLLGVTARVDLLFDVPPDAFYPVPDVTSTFVRMVFPETPPVPVRDRALLTRLVKASFAGRRKTLRNTLKNAGAVGVTEEDIIVAAGAAEIDLSRRAETLSPEEFARFADALTAYAVP